ncbi:hypothetical protein IAU59_006160 [Kwoniella sp. CBS 9459]
MSGPPGSHDHAQEAGSSSTFSSTDPNSNPKELKEQADTLVAEGKKAIALKQWEEGVMKYGEALDLMRQLVGEFDPQMAPLLLSYGKALYELAFSQQGVMGKEEPSKEADDAVQQGAFDGPATKGNFVFSADATSDDEADEPESGAPAAGPSEAASASTSASAPPADDNRNEEGESEEDEEPEDDYNAAWEVLDVARTIYQKVVEDGKSKSESESEAAEKNKEDRLNLAECYVALGDVSCETENFPQAVQDYTSALEIKSALLPASSRALASVHYQLATVLEFTPNRRSDSLSHVEKALESFKLRLQELRSASNSKDNLSEDVAKLSEKERENEIKDVEALLGDLEVKIEELKAAPPAGDIVSESINHLLGQPEGLASGSAIGGASGDSGPVNDLTSMVKKKKPKAAAAAAAAATNNAAATTAAGANAAVQAVTEGVKQVVENVQAQVAAAQPVAEQVKDKIGEGAVALGEAVQSVGEGLKDSEKREGEEEEGRAAKKARTE